MANYKTKGIILKRSNLGEADRILTVYTQDYGKIKAIGKGIRKQTSKYAGHLEPFCLVNLVIAEGKNLDIITEAEIIECFYNIRNHLRLTNVSYYFAEVIDKLTHEGEKHPEILRILIEVLKRLNKEDESLLLAYFEINLLKELGFAPDLYNCVVCREKITSKDNKFDFEEGGVVCKNCQSTGKKISDESIKILRLLVNSEIIVLDKIKANKKILSDSTEIMKEYINYIYQATFKSRKYID